MFSCQSPMLILNIYMGWHLCAVSNDNNVQCNAMQWNFVWNKWNCCEWNILTGHSLARSHHLSMHFRSRESGFCHFFVCHIKCSRGLECGAVLCICVFANDQTKVVRIVINSRLYFFISLGRFLSIIACDHVLIWCEQLLVYIYFGSVWLANRHM